MIYLRNLVRSFCVTVLKMSFPFSTEKSPPLQRSPEPEGRSGGLGGRLEGGLTQRRVVHPLSTLSSSAARQASRVWRHVLRRARRNGAWAAATGLFSDARGGSSGLCGGRIGCPRARLSGACAPATVFPAPPRCAMRRPTERGARPSTPKELQKVRIRRAPKSRRPLVSTPGLHGPHSEK